MIIMWRASTVHHVKPPDRLSCCWCLACLQDEWGMLGQALLHLTGLQELALKCVDWHNTREPMSLQLAPLTALQKLSITVVSDMLGKYGPSLVYPVVLLQRPSAHAPTKPGPCHTSMTNIRQLY